MSNAISLIELCNFNIGHNFSLSTQCLYILWCISVFSTFCLLYFCKNNVLIMINMLVSAINIEVNMPKICYGSLFELLMVCSGLFVYMFSIESDRWTKRCLFLLESTSKNSIQAPNKGWVFVWFRWTYAETNLFPLIAALENGAVSIYFESSESDCIWKRNRIFQYAT